MLRSYITFFLGSAVPPKILHSFITQQETAHSLLVSLRAAQQIHQLHQFYYHLFSTG